jgi:hypothetical protein
MSADTSRTNLNQPLVPSIFSADSLDIDAQQVDHLLIVKSFADDLDLVETVNRLAPTQMGVKPGTIVLGLILDTLSGRSPLYRLVEFFEGRDTELLLGERVPASVFNDDTVGRVLDLLFETGTQRGAFLTFYAIRGPNDSDELSSDANRHFSQTQPLPTRKPSELRERGLKNRECAHATDLFRVGYEGGSKTRDIHSYCAFRHHLGQCPWGISG